jgi:hypothetical protein
MSTKFGICIGKTLWYARGVTEEEHLALIREAREALVTAERTLKERIRAAYDDGVKTGKISHAAERSDTYVRALRDREEATA